MMVQIMQKNKETLHIQKLCFLGLVFLVTLIAGSRLAHAHTPCPLSGSFCGPRSCTETTNDIINDIHPRGERDMLSAMREDFHLHREWIVRDFFEATVLPALMLMTEQMSNIGMKQMQIVGEMFDAKLHLETMRLFNELKNEANRDYYPSEGMCYIGTGARSLSASDRRATVMQEALSQISMARLTGNVHGRNGVATMGGDKLGRWKQFRDDNCDSEDNNRLDPAEGGLMLACGAGSPADAERANRDIDYTRFVDEKRILDVDFTDNVITPEEEDIILMSNNLYGHDAPVSEIGFLDRISGQALLLQMRSVHAKRSVAKNTFNAHVGLKAVGSGTGDTGDFLRAILDDLGMSAVDIDEILGAAPSYYAQLEILSKKMFQTTDFFTDLYDKPANVERKSAALNAIELMLDRAIYESELRHEMLYSVLLSSYLEEDAIAEYERFTKAVNRSRR